MSSIKKRKSGDSMSSAREHLSLEFAMVNFKELIPEQIENMVAYEPPSSVKKEILLQEFGTLSEYVDHFKAQKI